MEKSPLGLEAELMLLLCELRSAIPLHGGCHHGILLMQYGAPDAGFEDRLAFVMRLPDEPKPRVLFIEPGDLDKPHSQLIGEIKAELRKPTDDRVQQKRTSAATLDLPGSDFRDDPAFMAWLNDFTPDWESEYSGNLRGMYCAFVAGRAGGDLKS
jgi:hypothetical protein